MLEQCVMLQLAALENSLELGNITDMVLCRQDAGATLEARQHQPGRTAVLKNRGCGWRLKLHLKLPKCSEHLRTLASCVTNLDVKLQVAWIGSFFQNSKWIYLVHDLSYKELMPCFLPQWTFSIGSLSHIGALEGFQKVPAECLRHLAYTA